ncbi:methylated-DNA--[protein]-cysteine S-methyltransferase [Kordiimonas marina]|uniref:methylated-DNA--[protein]-cysteine S-methyltransferase n=1 Tax=Kordiimonas marina TaxID=2872312 RepID=UPI001FF2D81F|nr:methylated-DNA--[protein]-cysteine S-methyltransferase [Kordiimonas marina]MCJ9429872.1 methylated-DNA--[protein]-cysteine S-methyltransferase [Kordiimonas marina]
MSQISMHTPVIDITLTELEGAIIAVDWGWSPFQEPTPLLREAKRQIDLYFDGELTEFDLPINPMGTKHQEKVWQAMCQIPYGETRTYGELAKEIGSSAQAVGSACGRNPLPILVPCHRVIASAGKLGGYSGEGGLQTKRALLVLEGALTVEEGIALEQSGALD